MTKKELQKQINDLTERLQRQTNDLRKELQKQEKHKKLLLDYFGLEIITEKSVGQISNYDNWYCRMITEDYIKYTDKIVKKIKNKKNK